METKLDARSRRNELHRGDRMRPYEDRTHPISCSAIAGISSTDRMLSEAVTGCTDFTVHRQWQRSQRNRTQRQYDRTHQEVASDHVQKGSRAAPTRLDASDRVRPDSAQSPINARAPMVGRTGRVRSGRDQRRSLAESWMSGPTASSHLWGYK